MCKNFRKIVHFTVLIGETVQTENDRDLIKDSHSTDSVSQLFVCLHVSTLVSEPRLYTLPLVQHKFKQSSVKRRQCYLYSSRQVHF